MTEQPAQQQPDSPKPDKTGGIVIIGCLGLFVFFGALLLIGMVTGGDSDSDRITKVRLACHAAVEAQAKNPDTVDFKTMSEVVSGSTMRGEFTANNDFNARQSFTYTCTVNNGQATAQISRK